MPSRQEILTSARVGWHPICHASYVLRESVENIHSD